jgi:hypothetical protein
MARQNTSPLKRNGFGYDSYEDNKASGNNITQPVEYKAFKGDFSTDSALDEARERKRTSTGLTGLEKKLAKTKPGSPEHIRLSAKLDKKNFKREKKSIKKNIRKYGEDADFSNISTEFMENLETGGTVGDTARRTKKQVDRFLNRDQNLRSIFTDKVDRKNVYNQGIIDRDFKIKKAADLEKAKQSEIDNRIQNNNVPGSYQNFGNDAFSSTFDRRFGSDSEGRPLWSITGSNRNPSKLPGDFSIEDYLNLGFDKTPKEETTGGMLQRGKPVSNKRPFISHTESVTAGKSIGSLMKKFK